MGSPLSAEAVGDVGARAIASLSNEPDKESAEVKESAAVKDEPVEDAQEGDETEAGAGGIKLNQRQRLERTIKDTFSTFGPPRPFRLPGRG